MTKPVYRHALAAAFLGCCVLAGAVVGMLVSVARLVMGGRR